MSEQYEDVCESNELLNTVLDNVDAGVLLMDDGFNVVMVNQTLLRLFDVTWESIQGVKCGNALGCIHAVLEGGKCGETSQCEECGLRGSVLDVMRCGVPSDRKRLRREFVSGGTRRRMFLEHSTRRVEHRGSGLILVVLYDVSELEQSRRDLMESKAQLDRDIEAAAEIQRSLLPSASPIARRLRFGWNFRPCAGVGGDLFHVARLDEKRVGMYMLDVCGHGVSAAMITVSVSRMMRPETGMLFKPGGGGEPLPPSGVMSMLEREYPFERFGSYFTMLYMIVDTEQGEMVWCSAGHPWPVLARRVGGETSVRTLDSEGPAIGIGADVPFSDRRLRLRQGDRVILYTDGILERADDEGEQYGEGRMFTDALRTADRPISEAMNAMLRDVLAFGGDTPPQDDIALLGFDYTESQG
ncbi:SpoIIE family protein phosphatase [Desulfohalovibrio reitneri]|uniref:SpoIIE family protein phosphatase n=1 Tax=Desulfohalovibrio reitneri TaxID=1307759 RepID=UPI0004A751CB|nr:SpoIIE family protein phosphatase [Desulfohalovibrio reitneri]